MESRDKSRIEPEEASRSAIGVGLAFLVGAFVWPAAAPILLPSAVLMFLLAEQAKKD